MTTVRIPAQRSRPPHRILPVLLPAWLRHQVPERWRRGHECFSSTSPSPPWTHRRASRWSISSASDSRTATPTRPEPGRAWVIFGADTVVAEVAEVSVRVCLQKSYLPAGIETVSNILNSPGSNSNWYCDDNEIISALMKIMSE